MFIPSQFVYIHVVDPDKKEHYIIHLSNQSTYVLNVTFAMGALIRRGAYHKMTLKRERLLERRPLFESGY